MPQQDLEHSGVAQGVQALRDELEAERSLRRDLESRVEYLTQKALESQQTKDQFLANMSHELRTPLNGIMGMAQLLATYNFTEEQLEYVQTIIASSEELLRLVEGVLTFSKASNANLQLDSASFFLPGCIEEACHQAARGIDPKAVELVFNIHPDVPAYVLGDEGRVRQLLDELLSNAVKFTKKGTISLEVEAASNSEGKTPIAFRLTDTGIGILPEQQQRIFESFYQVDSSLIRERAGAGLGLTLARQLVSIMGGTIQVESEIDQGSTFSFNLMLDPDPTQQEAPVYSLPSGVTCYVEHPVTQAYLTTILEQAGTSVHHLNALAQADTFIRERQSEQVMVIEIPHHMRPFESLLNKIGENAQQAGIKLLALLPPSTPLPASMRRLFAASLHLPIRRSVLFDQLEYVQDSQTSPKQASGLGLTKDHPPLRILVAEDNVINQRIALQMLKVLGHNADLASNGTEVMKALETKSYDVVLMDIQMPKMDGFATTTSIRNHLPRHAQPYIIAITGSIPHVDQLLFRKAGLDDVLPKPLKLDQLGNALSRCAPISV